MSEEGASDGEDRSHEPTQQKLRKSREKGDVPYSMEATAAATYAGFYIALIIAGGWTATKLSNIMAGFFHRPDDIGDLLLSSHPNNVGAEIALNIMIALAPLFALLAGSALCSIFAQQAFSFSLSKVKPKLSRISIIDNAKQKYGPNGLAEFLKSLVKVLVILSIVLFAFKDRFSSLPALSGLPVQAMLTLLRREAVFFIGFITAAAVGIAALDLPWRLYQHRKKLMMTFQELKEESKESEGDPSLKSARRQRAEAIATNRMMQDVPNADIIIVNPTHYAVALKWDREAGATPLCLAKGIDETAARIRAAAAEAGVPIRRDPPTARSIYSLVEVGHEIKREHYAAVAAAIHYADEMRKRWRKPYLS